MGITAENLAKKYNISREVRVASSPRDSTEKFSREEDDYSFLTLENIWLAKFCI